MNRVSSDSGKSAFDLMEEATHLLRSAPAATLAFYYVGSVPFVIGFLYFWADMSRSPFAAQHMAESAFGVTALFLWMKFWQSLFGQRILAQAAARPAPSWTTGQALRVLFSQAVIQPTGLFLIPAAFVVALPFGWVYAFYQTVTVFDDGRPLDIYGLVKRSWKQASLWPFQNHIVIATILLFGMCVFLDWMLVCLAIPYLFKMLLGIESIFTQSAFAMLNTTFLSAIAALTYLCLDPLVKAVYALRSFYGESLKSGEDLKANLKQFAGAAQWTAAGLIAIGLAFAVQASGQSTQPAVSADELDRQIEEVIHADRYAWRMPKVAVEEQAEKGVVFQFLDDVVDMFGRGLRSVLSWINNWLGDWLRSNSNVQTNPGIFGWVTSSVLLYVLLAAVIGFLGVFFIRVWRRRSRSIAPVPTQAIPYTPDVRDENTAADELPEDGWIRLAHSFLEKGELRLAMRAFYLSTLAHLGQRNLIAIARFKSNRDYQTELRRRAHAFPDLLPVFDENVSAFERIWYGMHEVNAEAIQQFAANVERLTGLKTLQTS
jgi:hypothetical protein